LVLSAGDPPAAADAERERDQSDRTEPDRDGPATPAAAGSPSTWAPSTLPRPTPLIGRSDELESIGSALRISRLVTVVGVGGVGKTRLVAEFVEHEARSTRVVSIELAAVAPDRVLATVGAALGARDERIAPEILVDVIGPEDVLVVLDNAEHVIEEVRNLVRQVLSACPNARFMLTSRERLALSAEVVVTLQPLGVDGPEADAVTLFVDRLRRARPHADVDADDATIAEMCRRLDGIPLALELTASRAATLGVSVLNERFDAMFGQLVDVDAEQHRHSTLGNVVHWSIELLSPQSQDLLAALSVFHGDFTLDAAESVGRAIDADEVTLMFGRLVDTSLVAEGSQVGRFRLLEMIREVARQRLVSSQKIGEVRRAHAEWVAGHLDDIEAASVGPSEAGTTDRLDAVRRELFAALEWSLDSGNVSIAASIVTSLAGPLLYRPDNELISAIRGIGGHGSISGSPDQPAVLAADARAAFLLGDLADVATLADRALLIADEEDGGTRHRALHALGVVSLYRGDFDDARTSFQQIVGDADPAIVARLDALGGLALALCYANDFSRARSVAEEHRAIADTLGSDTYLAFADYALAEIDLATGSVDAAAQRLSESADRAWQTQARFVWGIASTVLARVLVRHRPPSEARQHLPTLIERWRRTATWPQLWTTLRLGAEHLADTDDPRTALLILEAADRDAAAPSPSDEDDAVYRDIRDRIRQQIGEAAATGITGAAAAVDRIGVVQRTLGALSEPLGP
jgi:predicted ATPase